MEERQERQNWNTSTTRGTEGEKICDGGEKEEPWNGVLSSTTNRFKSIPWLQVSVQSIRSQSPRSFFPGLLFRVKKRQFMKLVKWWKWTFKAEGINKTSGDKAVTPSTGRRNDGQRWHGARLPRRWMKGKSVVAPTLKRHENRQTEFGLEAKFI